MLRSLAAAGGLVLGALVAAPAVAASAVAASAVAASAVAASAVAASAVAAQVTVASPAVASPAVAAHGAVAAQAAASCAGVRAVGDSVMLGAASQLRAKGMSVDAATSRSFRAGAFLAAGAAGSRAVVIHLGTNGPMSSGDFDAVMQRLRATPVVLVTVQLPAKKRYAYEGAVNAMLRSAAARYPNVRLVDWNGVTAAFPRLLAGDGIHLSPSGARAYADLVAGAACR